jgi:DNA polymerase-4
VAVPAIQTELPMQPNDPRRPGSAAGYSRLAVDTSIDAVRRRFGRDAVGYLPATPLGPRGVPDDFRELAEREL